MRFRLLRRRLTISAPRVAIAVRCRGPCAGWYWRLPGAWSAATALWAFEFGKSIAGLEPTSRQEVMQLRAEIDRLREQSQQTQLLSQTAESLLTADRATLERLTAQVKQLEAENRALRDDLGF